MRLVVVLIDIHVPSVHEIKKRIYIELIPKTTYTQHSGGHHITQRINEIGILKKTCIKTDSV